MKPVLISILVASLFALCRGANILMASPGTNPYIPSHVRLQSVLTRDLVQRGHRVVVMSSSILKERGYSADSHSDLITFKLPLDKDEYYERHERLFEIITKAEASLQELQNFSRTTIEHCGYLWQDKAALQRLKDENFDLMILNPFGQCEFLLHCYLDVPFVVFTPTTKYPHFNEDVFHFPSPASYVPGLGTGSSDQMSFLERTRNLLFRTVGIAAFSYFMISPYNKFKDEGNLCPDITLMELIGKADLWLANTNIALDFPHPSTPNFVPIGGLLTQPAKPLSKELADFVDGAGPEGVVVVSMGSGINLRKGDTTVFANVLGRLPQRVVWRHSGDHMPQEHEKLNDNIKIVKCLPQNDLLGHPNTKLFIGHAGINGIYEALYHAVPMVLLPFSFDQPDNAVRMAAKGVAVCLYRYEINENQMYEAVTDVLNNVSYAKAAKHWSAIYRDQPLSAREKATFWIEHVLKHGGAHLRPRGSDMGFIEYYMLDVGVFLLTIIVVLAWLVFTCCRRCCRAVVLQKQKSE